MSRRTYFNRFSGKRKYLIGRNLIIAGGIGIFLPLIPGIALIAGGVLLIYPRLYDGVKRLVTDESISSSESR